MQKKKVKPFYWISGENECTRTSPFENGFKRCFYIMTNKNISHREEIYFKVTKLFCAETTLRHACKTINLFKMKPIQGMCKKCEQHYLHYRAGLMSTWPWEEIMTS